MLEALFGIKNEKVELSAKIRTTRSEFRRKVISLANYNQYGGE
jgi:hypothetical protein